MFYASIFLKIEDYNKRGVEGLHYMQASLILR
jgi:hypothetical protein